MFIKTYNVPIHRKVATSELIKTTVSDSFFNLNVKKEKDSVVNTTYETIIHNIETHNNVVNIYSNTLNIKITDKVIDNIPLYKKLTLSIEDMYVFVAELKEPYLLNNTEEESTIYFNNINNILDTRIEYYYNIGNPLTRTSNIKVRKLKNRFKITVEGLSESTMSIILGSPYLFTPIVYNNHIEFYESLLTIGSTQHYLYNHSFDSISKGELSDSISSLKDPVIKVLTSTVSEAIVEPLYTYESWRSNLLFDEKLRTNLYYYLNINPTEKTDNIIQSYEKLENTDYILIYSSVLRDFEYSFTENPYLDTEIKDALGENFTLVFKEDLQRYSQYNDIKIGTERLVLDFEKILKNKTLYLKTAKYDLFQYDIISPYTTESVKNTQNLPLNFRENISNLENEIRHNINYPEEVIGNKIYRRENILWGQ